MDSATRRSRGTWISAAFPTATVVPSGYLIIGRKTTGRVRGGEAPAVVERQNPVTLVEHLRDDGRLTPDELDVKGRSTMAVNLVRGHE